MLPEDQFEKLFNLSPAMLGIAGMDGYFKELNNSWERELGYSIEELKAKPFISFVYPADHKTTLREVEKLKDESYSTIEFKNRYKHKNGSLVWLSWYSYTDKETGLIYCTAVNITQQQTRNQLAKHREQLFEETGALAKVGGWEFDVADPNPYWTKEVYKIHELDENVQPELSKAIDFYAPEARPVISALVEKAMQTGEPWDVELPFITAKGSRLWVRAMGKAELVDGKAVRLFGAFQNITEQYQLRQRLEEALAKTEAASEAKSKFISSVSHELRTPLNSIIGFTNRLVKNLKDKIEARHLDALETVERNGHQLLGLINDILDISQLESGKMKASKQVIAVEEALHPVVKQLVPLSEQKGLALMIDEVPADLTVYADKKMFTQILINLVSNAIKYTPEGYVRITFEVDLSADPMLIFKVQDSGIGINDEDLQKLFTTFYRCDTHLAHNVAGSGLGLSIVKEYVDMHQGSVGVESEEGVGSMFYVKLPIHPPAQSQP